MKTQPQRVAVLTPDEINEIARQAGARAAREAVQGVAGDLKRLSGILQEQRGVLGKQQAMDLLEITDEGTLRKYVQMGLRCYKPGRRPLFLLEDIIAFLKEHPE